MSTISPTTNQSLTLQDAVHTSRDSIEKLLNSLTGKKVNLDDAESMKINEEVLFAANLHSKLAAQSGRTGKEFLHNVKTMLADVVKSSSRPIFEAARKAFEKLVEEKKVQGNSKEIQQNAYVLAQQDTNGAVSNRLRSSNLNKVESKSVDQNISKDKVESDLSKAVVQAKGNSPTTMTKVKSDLNKMINSIKLGKSDKETKPVENKPIKPTTPIVAEQTVTGTFGTPIKPTVVETANEITVTPVDTKKSFPSIKIPLRWYDEIKNVIVQDQYGDEVGIAEKMKDDKTGREVYGYNGEGKEKVAKFLLLFNDNSYLEVTPDNISQGLNREMYS